MNNNPASQSSSKNLLLLAGVIIAVLIGIIIYLFNNKQTLIIENQQVKTALDETTQLKEELEVQYEEALADLESLRGENEALNQLIDNQKMEITGQKNRILSLLKNSNALGKAKAEINKLNEQIAFFKEEREKWALEKESLLAEKIRQDSINQSLNSKLDESKETNDYLTSVTRDLTLEKSKLEKEKNSLAKKMDKASMIKTEKITIKTLQKKDNGKNVSRKNAENVNMLEICFLPMPNAAASGEGEKFKVRVISPNGETMTLGTSIAVFIQPDSGDEMQYTFETREIQSIDGSQNACFNWEPSKSLSAGTYKVEIYNKGYLAGTSSFSLK
ncbi:MAG: hypothetical protein ACKOZZ_04370 [Bacteroidota bacterium]|jgi:myosin heavy subunit